MSRRVKTRGRLTVAVLATQVNKGFRAGDKRFKFIEEQLHHITHEVTANGSQGLDASLKDIYHAVGKIEQQVGDVLKATEGTMARRDAVRSVKKAFSTSIAGKLGKIKFVRLLLLVIGLVIVDGVLNQFGIHILEFLKLSIGGF